MEDGRLRSFLVAGWLVVCCVLAPGAAVADPAAAVTVPATAGSAAPAVKHHRHHRRHRAAVEAPSNVDAAVAAGATLPPVQQQTYYTSPGGTYPSAQGASGASAPPSPYPPASRVADAPSPPLPVTRAATPSPVLPAPLAASPSPPLSPSPTQQRMSASPALPPAAAVDLGSTPGYTPNAPAVPAQVPSPVLPALSTPQRGIPTAQAAEVPATQIPNDVPPPEPVPAEGWQSRGGGGGGSWAAPERAPTPYAAPNTVAPSRAPSYESTEPVTTMRSAQGTGGMAPPATSLGGSGLPSQAANSGTAVTPLGPSYAVTPQQSAEQTTAPPSGFVIGVGDTINVTVYGRSELSGIVTVSSDGSVSLSLIGDIALAGLTPADAAAKIAKAYRQGQFLLNPQVSVVPTEFRSKQISVLGEVKNPGRFPVNTSLNVLDALALAGGIEETGSREVYVLRPKNNAVERHEIDLDALVHANQGNGAANSYFPIMAGDTVVVPKADQFYIYGEVRQPNAYRIVPNLTVMQAISMAGGLTDKGSDSRVEIRRRQGGTVQKRDAKLEESVKPDDVIYVHERLF